ncbi:MAG TPA: alpha/beta hydrolase [Actinobacteria bacterium]|nr:alpha/beta hydrolase [Actinomycetota bacterium]
MDSFTVDVDGPVHAIDYGGQGDPLLLVHGLGGSVANWIELGPRLTSLGRVVAVDLPGFGRTPPAGRSAHIDAQQAFLARFIGSVLGGPVTLVGNSMGGLIAMLQAARRPELVRRLVLLDPAAPAPMEWRSIDRNMFVMAFGSFAPPFGKAVLNAVDRSMTPAQRVAESFALVTADPGGIGKETTAAHVTVAAERRTQPWANTSFLTAYRSILVRLLPHRYREVVDSISAPTLLVHGTADRVVPYVASARLAGRKPDWDFQTLEGAGHVPMLERPDEVCKMVAEFFENATVVERQAT